MFLEIILPILFMVFGVAVSSIDTFVRSPSEILSPKRVGYPNQLIYMNKGASSRNILKKTVKDIGKIMQKKSKGYLKVRTPDKKLSFDSFHRYVYKYGKEDAPKMPYCYSGYSFFEARNDQYKFYNFMNLTN
jgi:hypothetical protein